MATSPSTALSGIFANEIFSDDSLLVRVEYNAKHLPIYIGHAVPGTPSDEAKWRIKRLTYNGTDMTLREFADGNTSFHAVWDDILTLSYS